MITMLLKEVIKIENDGDVISTVITKNGIYTTDLVISGADYAHTEKLLNPNVKAPKLI